MIDVGKLQYQRVLSLEISEDLGKSCKDFGKLQPILGFGKILKKVKVSLWVVGTLGRRLVPLSVEKRSISKKSYCALLADKSEFMRQLRNETAVDLKKKDVNNDSGKKRQKIGQNRRQQAIVLL